MENDRTEFPGPFALETTDEAGWRAIAEMSQKADGCEQIVRPSTTRLTATDENGWRNIASSWEAREHEDATAELAVLRSLVQDVLDHWHSDYWALSPFSGVREWQKKALETLTPKGQADASKAVASLHAGSELRFAEVMDDAPVWL